MQMHGSMQNRNLLPSAVQDGDVVDRFFQLPGEATELLKAILGNTMYDTSILQQSTLHTKPVTSCCLLP